MPQETALCFFSSCTEVLFFDLIANFLDFFMLCPKGKLRMNVIEDQMTRFLRNLKFQRFSKSCSNLASSLMQQSLAFASL